MHVLFFDLDMHKKTLMLKKEVLWHQATPLELDVKGWFKQYFGAQVGF